MMDIVYLVYWCNNEPYEDYYETVDAVFADEDAAIAFIEGNGYTLDEPKPWRDGDRWSKITDQDFGETNSMWIRPMEVRR